MYQVIPAELLELVDMVVRGDQEPRVRLRQDALARRGLVRRQREQRELVVEGHTKIIATRGVYIPTMI
jgi:hypothetical protein